MKRPPESQSVFSPRLLVAWLFAAILVAPIYAEPRVLSSGTVPQDKRLEPLKDLNGYFPFTPSENPERWQARATQVRHQLLVSLGLWPLPTRTPLNPVVHGKVERDDYTVERVFFESMPGFYVTGSLYRPMGKSGRVPGVLCPHGHWPNGRFHDAGEGTAKKEIEAGAEKFAEGARSPLQARCVHLARMGCVVFHYDMIGYADSQQISFDVAHRFAKQRPEMISAENWGLFSPQAESHFQSIMGLQSWNSIRALDFLSSLPDVDPQRLAVTGASGGGTQTFVVGAIDPRPAAVFPAVMVSTAMQGGCTCENASCMRIDTGNVEFAALFAPKPQGLSAANDWTKEMATKGFPELQKHYEMLGARDNVFLISRTEFGHNYNAVCREAMYQWFHKALGLGEGNAPAERDFERLTQAEMTVWNDEHPQPEQGPDFEKKLLKWWTEDAGEQLAAIAPRHADSLAKYRSTMAPAYDVILGRRSTEAKDLEYDQKIKEDRGDFLFMAGLLRDQPRGIELPVAFFYPKTWSGDVVVWLHENGKAGLFAGDEPRAEVKRLIAAGKAVAGVDLLYQGEFLADSKPLEKAPRVQNTRESAAYTFGYNHSVFAQRVQDVTTLVAFVKNHERTPKSITLVGLGGVPGAWAAAARTQLAETVDRAAIDTSGFRFLNVNDIYAPEFLPGGAKYGDVPGMLAFGAPGALWLAGEKADALSSVKSAYDAAAQSSRLTTYDGPADATVQAAIDYLLQ